MSWIRGRYYIRSVYGAGRQVSQYVGSGAEGAAAAAHDAEARASRRAAAQVWQAKKARLLALDALVDQLDEKLQLLIRAHLLAAGYHQHHRGEWRKFREKKTPK